MVEGKLDEEVGGTVLIVDEVDDLIVNERPNSHYAKADAEFTPELCACYSALKEGAARPPNVSEEAWARASQDVAYCQEHKQRDVHWRVIVDDRGRRKAIMLDAEGRVPKVALT